MKYFRIFFALLWVSQCLGCGGSSEAPPPGVKEITPPIDPATVGRIKGTVLFSGAVPQPKLIQMGGNPECSDMQHGPLYSEELLVRDGKLQNAIVCVKKGLEAYRFPVPEKSVLMDQKNCMFAPHVIAVQAYQPIELRNSDPTLHNVNARPKNSRGFNLGFPTQGMRRSVTLAAPEMAVPIRCDLHPWMQGWIGVLANPYFQVTGSDWKFSLENLPPGKYEVEAWHEKLGALTQTVEVGPRQSRELSFTFEKK